MVPVPPYMRPFVLPVAEVRRERAGAIDIYRPQEINGEPEPIIVFVPGGPLPPDLQAMPRDWPVFVGYGSLAAAHGAVGITVEHHLYSLDDYAAAADEVAAAVDTARNLPGVGPDRVALWFFSGGGLLSADWLRMPPSWLRCVAASYPVLAPLPGWRVDARFDPVAALASATGLPILLTRVGRERPEIAATVAAFSAAATRHRAELEVIDVPDAHHAFDTIDDTDASRTAISRAMSWVTSTLSA
ncbi:hypothetical protein GCM10023319_52130 [Nocardia iowensis]